MHVPTGPGTTYAGAVAASSTEIVTGDAVLLEMRPARVPARVLSALIDVAIVTAGGFAWNWVLQEFRQTSAARIEAVALVGQILIALAYPIATETLTRGRTVGALVVGLRATRDDGGVIRFRHALIRWVTFWAFDFAVWTAMLGGLICASLHPQGKRLGDLLAGTMVIRTRAPRAATAPPPEVATHLADWAARLELGRVPQELLTAARHFVQRRDGLLLHPRTSIAHDLAQQIYARISPPPPETLEPEDFLIAVVAERRRRELARVSRSRQEWVPAAEELPAGWR